MRALGSSVPLRDGLSLGVTRMIQRQDIPHTRRLWIRLHGVVRARVFAGVVPGRFSVTNLVIADIIR